MHIFFLVVLFIFGLLFGSFSSVVIHRLKSGKGGIIGGRSYCPNCKNTLKFYDLFPIFSWISTLGKCRYCKNKISIIYPILELSMGIIFSLIGYFLIDFNLIINGNLFEIIKLFYWLSIGFITIIYIYYDILFLEIHESVMISGIILAFLGLIANTYNFNLIDSVTLLNDSTHILSISSLILGITIIGALYIIMLKELKIIYDIIILTTIIGAIIVFKNFFNIDNLLNIPIINGLIGALAIFIFFFLQIVLSGGKALGGGDLRIGIMIGLLLGASFSFPGMMISYFIGSIIGIFIIILGKIKNNKKKISTQVPFGPFLGLGFFVSIFFLNYISNIIEIYF